MDRREGLARQLHEWYLEATKELQKKSYNTFAQKPYERLTKEQKYISQYIAKQILAWLDENYEEKKDGGIIKGPFKDCDCKSHHQHGPKGLKGCAFCNPTTSEHYEEKGK